MLELLRDDRFNDLHGCLHDVLHEVRHIFADAGHREWPDGRVFEGTLDPCRDHDQRVTDKLFHDRDAAQHPVEPRERSCKDIDGKGALAEIDVPLCGYIQIAAFDNAFRQR
jgi:hypothetical protein